MSSVRYRTKEKKEYIIKSKGVRRDLSREHFFSIFEVKNYPNDETVGKILIGITEHLVHLWGYQDDRSLVEKLLLMYGFMKIEETIESGLDLNYEFVFTAYNTSHQRPLIEKNCPHLSINHEQNVCLKASEEKEDHRQTNNDACLNCDFPIFFQKCQYLVDVKTKGVFLPNGDIQMRRVEEFTCGRGEYSNSPGLCFTRECFEPSYAPLSK